MNRSKRIQRAFIILLLVCGAIMLLAVGFKQKAPLAIVLFLFLASLLDGLLSREVYLGLGSARRRYTREHQPKTYWMIVLFYFLFMIFSAVSLFSTNEPENRAEPNKVVEPTPVAVTSCAGAHLAPPTSVAHL